jgi:uncharacterized protein GlcG (DUF336 family)
MTDVLTIARADLTLAGAQRLAAAARAAAVRERLAVAVAVVDSAGHPILVERMDGTAICAVPLALAKAEAAAATLSPTSAWYTSTQPGQPDWGMTMALGGRFTALPGGLPVTLGGQVVGAVGVSGAESQQDVACVEAALAAVGANGSNAG